MNILFENRNLTVNEAVDYYKSSEFASPTRSTVPLLLWLQQEEAMVKEIIQKLGVIDPKEFHLEYKVKPKKGKGNASHTDLFVISEITALALEAKWTEKRYQSVKKWKADTKNPDNKEAVLQGWIEFLQPYSNNELNIDKMDNVVYQLIHRAASACAEGRNPKLAYLLFTESYSIHGYSYIESDLRNFKNLLGTSNEFPFYFIEVLISPTKKFEDLSHMKKNTKETIKAVKSSIEKGEHLFNFIEYRITTI